MKQRIYLSICLFAVGVLTSCGEKAEPPTVVVTPTPTPILTPSPVASLPPTGELPPPVQPLPAPVGRDPIIIKRIPIADLPTSIYPKPAPVPILVTPAPVKTPAPAKAKANQKEEPVSKLNIPTDPAWQITPIGIGSAKIGMSFKELKQQMGDGFEFPVTTSFMDGFDAIAVTKSGKIQYYIPYPSGTKFTDEDRIQHLTTDNPDYRTEQGVGPGTPIKQATSVYGGATLSLSKENESREFISFTKHPNGIAFRPKPAGTHPFAGDYPESNDEYLKTQKYDSQAAIGQITVSCAEEQCGKELEH